MSFLFGKKTNVTTAAERISAFQSTTCDFGTPLPYVFGTSRRGPNLINYQDFYAQPIVTKVKSGKRSSSTNIDYKYYAYVELALCEGVIDGVGKLWVGDKAYDSLAVFNATAGTQGAPLSLNTGSSSLPTIYMSTKHPDIAVGYNNMAYLYGCVFLGDNSASIPSYGVEVQGLLRGSGDGVDANPAAVISYLLTTLGYGNNIDNTSYLEYWQYCSEADILVSTPQDAFTSQKKAQEVIKELLTLTNTYMFWSVNKFKFIPRDTKPRGGWTPRGLGSGPNLTPDDMMTQSDGACVMYERKDSSEIYNRFGVTFTSRANNYEAETVFYEDTGDILTNGIKSAPDLDGKWLHTVERAVTVAEMQARINRTENIKYTFRLPWAYAYLEPGDIVTLTDPEIGLDHQLVMIDTVTEQDDETLVLTALRRETDTAVTYDTGSDDYNDIDNNGDPDDTAAPVIFTPPAALATSSNLEVWIAAHGQVESWGGCLVYSSTKDGDYEMAGTHNRNSNYGTLLTSLTADGTSVDIEFTNVNTVELPAGSAQDAADGLCDIYIDGEFCRYTAATLIGANQYRLTLLRGAYGSTASAHSSGASFAMMDENLYSLILPQNLAGKTLYLKFPSFNTIGSRTQDLADINYYTFTAAAEGYTQAYTENYVGTELAGYAEVSDLDDYVEKTSADYIKSASVSGNTLTLTKGNDGTVTFTPSGGGGGGSYSAGDGIDITNNVISLETASANDIGGIKVGSGLSIDSSGVLSATGGGGTTYTAGDGIDITSDVISLETASANDIGGIKVGTNLSIDGNGVLSATDTTYSDFVGSGSSAAHGLVPAPPTTAGTTKYLREDGSWSVPSGGGGGGSYTAGDGIDITSDVISLEKASTTDIGGIIVGNGLSVDADGILSVVVGGGDIVTDTLFSDSSGVYSGDVALSGNISDYDFIEFTTDRTRANANYKNACKLLVAAFDLYTFNSPTSSGKSLTISGYDNDYLILQYVNDTKFNIFDGRNLKLKSIVGIKTGGGGGLSPSDITTGSTNGTISVDGTDVAVAGLNSSAYLSTDYYHMLATSQSTKIAQNTDLNTITGIGTYYCESNADAQTLSNCPIAFGFKMIVEQTTTSSYILQKIIRRVGSQWQRYTSDGGTTWNSWSAYNSTDDYLPLSGGTVSGNLTVSGTLTASLTGNADTASQLVSTKIPANSDLNNYTTVGDYYTATDADASSLSNCPSSISFYMQVRTAGARYLQIIYTYNAIYTRRRTTSNWSSWYKYTGTQV